MNLADPNHTARQRGKRPEPLNFFNEPLVEHPAKEFLFFGNILTGVIDIHDNYRAPTFAEFKAHCALSRWEDEQEARQRECNYKLAPFAEKSLCK